MDQLSQNVLKRFRKLTNKKYRQLENKFVIEGLKICSEALSSSFNIIALFICSPMVPSPKQTEFIQICKDRHIPCYSVDERVLSMFSDTINSQGVIAIVEKQTINLNFEDIDSAVIIDAAQDPGNVGTIIRTCDWFGIDSVFLGKGTVELYNPKVLRSTMGSIFHIPIFENVDCLSIIHEFKSRYFTIFAADSRGDTNLYSVEKKNKFAILFGNESAGIHARIQSETDYRVQIPNRGRAESLNLAVAAGILISYMVNHA